MAIPEGRVHIVYQGDARFSRTPTLSVKDYKLGSIVTPACKPVSPPNRTTSILLRQVQQLQTTISTSNPPPRWPSPRRAPPSTTTSRKRHRLIPYQHHQYRLSSFKPRSRRPPSQSLQTSPHHRWKATQLLPAPRDLEAIQIRDSTPPK